MNRPQEHEYTSLVAYTRVLEEYMDKQLDEKDAEIERLCDSVNYKHSKICELGNQLAAQEVVIQQLRDALKYIRSLDDDLDFLSQADYDVVRNALAIPNSTVHLEAWYKDMVGEPVGHFYETAEYSYTQCWTSDTEAIPFHAIKPFPFKEK